MSFDSYLLALSVLKSPKTLKALDVLIHRGPISSSEGALTEGCEFIVFPNNEGASIAPVENLKAIPDPGTVTPTGNVGRKCPRQAAFGCKTTTAIMPPLPFPDRGARQALTLSENGRKRNPRYHQESCQVTKSASKELGKVFTKHFIETQDHQQKMPVQHVLTTHADHPIQARQKGKLLACRIYHQKCSDEVYGAAEATVKG
mmetsp:Transcript_9449/g.35382  ORF Transcript_9449/g.35382 Transcript_9449/m.35382 type:complete len:202 (+) Transcript_9449:125-730(+)